jgi:hypothetical protein
MQANLSLDIIWPGAQARHCSPGFLQESQNGICGQVESETHNNLNYRYTS